MCSQQGLDQPKLGWLHPLPWPCASASQQESLCCTSTVFDLGGSLPRAGIPTPDLKLCRV